MTVDSPRLAVWMNRLSLSMCFKKTVLDLSFWKGSKKVTSHFSPLYYLNDEEHSRSLSKASNFLLKSTELDAIGQMYINNDNKQWLTLLNSIRSNLSNDLTIFPLSMKDALIKTLQNSRKDAKFLVFNFDDDVSEVYYVSPNKLDILSLTTDISLYEAFEKMTSYLNAQENLNELGVNMGNLHSLAQIFDEQQINIFQSNESLSIVKNLDLEFVPILRKFNAQIFEKEGVKKKTYNYIKPLTLSDKLGLYDEFSQEIFSYVHNKMGSLLDSLTPEEKEKCYYVLWGESFRNETFRSLINELCKKSNLPPEASVESNAYSEVIQKSGKELSEKSGIRYSIQNISAMKLYDKVHISLLRF